MHGGWPVCDAERDNVCQLEVDGNTDVVQEQINQREVDEVAGDARRVPSRRRQRSLRERVRLAGESRELMGVWPLFWTRYRSELEAVMIEGAYGGEGSCEACHASMPQTMY